MVMSVKAILLNETDLEGTLMLNFVSDEETGGLKGTKYILDKGYVHPNYVIIGEQTNNRIAIAENGVLWYNIKTFGRAAHVSNPSMGVNAIENMLKLLNIIDEKIRIKINIQRHPLTPPPSLTISVIKGGIKTNVVPDLCEVSLDRRFLPYENPQDLIQEIFDIVEEIERKDSKFKVKVDIPLIGLPVNTSPNEKIVKIIRQVYKDLNLNDELTGYMHASDGRFFSNKGIPTVILGPGDPNLAHAPNEYVSLKDVVIATKIYALLTINALQQSANSNNEKANNIEPKT
jgi:succinyl-diaminopimelate desuccinylase